ncbi:hypothetical protein Back11_57250 [Paenibacillus baekrokdamisoli]|uniref:Uncharacterized protein n=1 Tax=Paenibacillus baekrokdamisoli TaxID=1712516 RepID=A0A3G9IZQ6_9BACL|nr:hypothetical protein [Paenibacillus baekrokdamisoli]MBB3072819.1 hypothetical protein [Paenibacillus baekrokdamisoli]BBH24380.1 hypothetical protein Back11_57250 [Paenibacillus baekrokdamisoli]
MNLILIEGIPGSGKSTTARFIALQAERNGLKTELFHESTFQHPIFIQEPITNYKDWMERYITNWDKFLSEQSDTETTIVMESALFQSPILHLLHMDIDREVIVQFIEKIYARLTNMNCSLIYLYQDDPNIGINRMMDTRGGRNWLNKTYEQYKHEPYYANQGDCGPDVHLNFLYEYAQVAISAYSKCSLNTLAIENTNWDWTTYHSKILNYYGWSYDPDPVVPLSELQQYTGIYRNEEMNVDIHIEIKEGHLIIFGDRQLKPKGINSFYLDNISIVVNFVRIHTEPFNQFIIEEKDLVGNQKDEGTRFVRTQR